MSMYLLIANIIMEVDNIHLVVIQILSDENAQAWVWRFLYFKRIILSQKNWNNSNVPAVMLSFSMID